MKSEPYDPYSVFGKHFIQPDRECNRRVKSLRVIDIICVKSGKIVIDIKKDNKTIAAEKAQAAREKAEAERAEALKKMQEKAAAKEAEKKAKVASPARRRPLCYSSQSSAPGPSLNRRSMTERFGLNPNFEANT